LHFSSVFFIHTHTSHPRWPFFSAGSFFRLARKKTLRHESELNLSLYVIDNNDLLSSRKVYAKGGRLWGEEMTGIVFGLWQLVFGLIPSTCMTITPKTKDQQLKTETPSQSTKYQPSSAGNFST